MIGLQTMRARKVDRNIINEVINKITLIETCEESAALLKDLLSSESTQIISFLNAHGFNLCHRDRNFVDSVLQSDLILRDGIGMQLLFKALGIDAGLNMNGTDVIPALQP